MAIVLAALGVFLTTRLEAALDRSIDQSLRGRAGDLRLVVSRAAPGLGAGVEPVLESKGESFAQLLDTRGTVVDRTPDAGRASLLTPGQPKASLLNTRSATSRAEYWRTLGADCACMDAGA